MASMDEMIKSADRVEYTTAEKAKSLPGMLGRIAPAALALKGWYGYTETDGDKRVLLVSTGGEDA